jgi:hypothetical protein
MARPPKDIDWDKVLMRMQCGGRAKVIARLHRINIDTLYDRFKKEFGCSFSDYSDGEVECGKDNIAYMQYAKAMSGNVQMLTLLGKEWNGQGADLVALKAPLQNSIDKDHIIMQLENRIAVLEANANEPKTE